MTNTNQFGQPELTAQQHKNLFFQDVRLMKNLLLVKYMKARNEGVKGRPDIKFDMTPQEAYESAKDDRLLIIDAGRVAVSQLKRDFV